MYTKISFFIATGFYSGYSPRAPGTVGTIVFWLIWIAIYAFFKPENLLFPIIATLLLTVIGLLTTKKVLDIKEDKDPQCVVIDEWAGLAVTLCFIHGHAYNLNTLLVALVGFRLFDITKIWPVSALERLPGALGVMADDLMAGLMAGICTLLLIQSGIGLH